VAQASNAVASNAKCRERSLHNFAAAPAAAETFPRRGPWEIILTTLTSSRTAAGKHFALKLLPILSESISKLTKPRWANSKLPGNGARRGAVGSRVLADIGINIVGVFRIDGKAQHTNQLLLGAVTRSAGIITDDIEKLRPRLPVFCGFVQTADICAGVNDILIVQIVENAIDKTAGADSDVLPSG